MTNKDTEMFNINSYDLDVEELEERLELAALFAMKPSAVCGGDACAANFGTPCGANACAVHWCPCGANVIC